MATFFLAMITILLDGVPPAAHSAGVRPVEFRPHHRRRLCRLASSPRCGTGARRCIRAGWPISPPPSVRRCNQALAGLHRLGLSDLGAKAAIARTMTGQAYLLAADDIFWISGWICIRADRHGVAVPQGQVGRRACSGRLKSAATGYCSPLCLFRSLLWRSGSRLRSETSPPPVLRTRGKKVFVPAARSGLLPIDLNHGPRAHPAWVGGSRFAGCMRCAPSRAGDAALAALFLAALAVGGAVRTLPALANSPKRSPPAWRPRPPSRRFRISRACR